MARVNLSYRISRSACQSDGVFHDVHDRYQHRARVPWIVWIDRPTTRGRSWNQRIPSHIAGKGTRPASQVQSCQVSIPCIQCPDSRFAHAATCRCSEGCFCFPSITPIYYIVFQFGVRTTDSGQSALNANPALLISRCLLHLEKCFQRWLLQTLASRPIPSHA